MERRAIFIRGTVQGVGFRPFVYGLAVQASLDGFVQNQSGSVYIEVEGHAGPLDRFIANLTGRAPALARIDDVSWKPLAVLGLRGFIIKPSSDGASGPIVIAPDTATCDACLAELFNPRDRRYRYPFNNCTNCGPRLSIVTGSPYDRAKTTMAGFAMCPACRAEYENPADRRFHAQPIACPVCGPKLQALDAFGADLAFNAKSTRGIHAATEVADSAAESATSVAALSHVQVLQRSQNPTDPLAWFVAALIDGKIGAMKGLGGYHLICDAANVTAVAELRRRKHRDEKPFAVMVVDLATAEALCEIGPAERELLVSSRRPIVLLKKHAGDIDARGNSPADSSNPRVPSASVAAQIRPLADAIAPGNAYLGLMLPYTPLHHLLLRDINRPLVMTSGNRSDEPIAYEEPDAIERLSGIADVFLVHNRPIHVRCDDSVTRVIAGEESPIRRSRGYAPQPIRLPMSCPIPLLAVGGQMKSTFALGRDRQAVLSQHMGDLEHFAASQAFERDVALYEELFSLKPQCIVHDLHPDYASTRYALRRAKAEGIRTIGVQHHHAHLASCMAEHGLQQPVIGVIWDGTGFGTDGTVWGGEFLVGDYATFRRAAHLRTVPLPGGEKAVREPWRMAAAYLADANVICPSLEQRITPAALRTVRQMIDRRFNSPLTSSAGRLFDAVASIANIKDVVSYEGQAAIELERLATMSRIDRVYPFDILQPDSADGARVIDSRPMMRAIVDDVGRGEKAESIARKFQSTLVSMICEICEFIRTETGVTCVVLSGGVFMNALLAREVVDRLAKESFQVCRHSLVPPNDGGISLGQVAIAASQLASA